MDRRNRSKYNGYRDHGCVPFWVRVCPLEACNFEIESNRADCQSCVGLNTASLHESPNSQGVGMS